MRDAPYLVVAGIARYRSRRGFNPRVKSMNKLRFSAALLACCAILIASTQKLRAAELRLLAGGAMAGIWTEMKPQFEQAS